MHRGKTQILVSTADGSYVQIPVSVYDYSSVRFSNENITQTLMLGKQNEVEVDLIEGNDDYSFTSDNPRVSAFYNDATGKVTVSAKAGKEEYTATLTCTDGSDRKGTIKVTVTPSFEAFTADEINDIKANTRSEIWADVKDPSDGNTPTTILIIKTNIHGSTSARISRTDSTASDGGGTATSTSAEDTAASSSHMPPAQQPDSSRRAT